jgi:hypothetical protein
MSFGDYIQLQRENHRFAVDANITATAQAATAAVTAKSANHQIYVQRITLSITTHANAKVALTVQSSNGTPVVIASRTDLTAAAGVPDVIVWDFGPIGTPVAKGENLNWLWSTGDSGPTGRAHIEGYQKLIGPVAQASTN